MDDIMNLMHKIIIDIQGFNETHFEIFDNCDKERLLDLWKREQRNINSFISHLSPDQKQQLVDWAIERTSYNKDELVEALTKFLKFLRSAKGDIYPLEKKKKKVKWF